MEQDLQFPALRRQRGQEPVAVGDAEAGAGVPAGGGGVDAVGSAGDVPEGAGLGVHRKKCRLEKTGARRRRAAFGLDAGGFSDELWPSSSLEPLSPAATQTVTPSAGAAWQA